MNAYNKNLINNNLYKSSNNINSNVSYTINKPIQRLYNNNSFYSGGKVKILNLYFLQKEEKEKELM